MRGVGIIFRREMAAYFTSPIAYAIAAAFLLITGLIFNTNITLSVTQNPVNPAEVPNVLAFFMIFFGPVLTMRLLSEEARRPCAPPVAQSRSECACRAISGRGSVQTIS